MSRYDSMIDVTDFGVVAGYLHGPHSPIRWLLHVRERGMLGEVAELIERSEQLGLVRPNQFPWVVKPYLREGKMLLSTRPGSEMENEATIDASLVPRNARSEVIYMEPSYLVHTPGLFDKHWELEVPTREAHLALSGCNSGPAECSLFEPLGADPRSTAVPEKDFEPIFSPVGKDEEMPTEWVIPELMTHDLRQSIKAPAHIHRLRGEEDARRRSKRYHGR